MIIETRSPVVYRTPFVNVDVSRKGKQTRQWIKPYQKLLQIVTVVVVSFVKRVHNIKDRIH